MKKYKLLQDYRTPHRVIPAGTIIEIASGAASLTQCGYTYIHEGLPVLVPIDKYTIESTPDWFELVPDEPKDVYGQVVSHFINNFHYDSRQHQVALKEKFVVFERNELAVSE